MAGRQSMPAERPTILNSRWGGLGRFQVRTLGALLLADDAPCKLGFIRCDAFELLPGTTEVPTRPT